MLKRKCPGCAEKIEKKFNFCPWCGQSIKGHREEEDFGLLGRTDNVNNMNQAPKNQPQLPFGLDKIMGGLIKQLEKELSGMDKQNGMPKGFNIRIQTQNPNQNQVNMNQQQQAQKATPKLILTEKESTRRQTLPKQEAESKVKRLSDKIIYEINAPGIKNKEDIIITKLEQGFEIKVYTKDTCYTKTIPLQIEIIGYTIQDNKLIVELKN
jgi:hypothetical protein